jgi:uncharacterized protein YeaO (DUF488 family)
MSDHTPAPGGELKIARVYDPPDADQGERILVDRLWPRGLAKEAAALDDWCKAVAPSDELRRWYGHDPERLEEFAARYRAELEQPERARAVQRIADSSRQRMVTLLTATKELDLSHAAILAEAIDEAR